MNNLVFLIAIVLLVKYWVYVLIIGLYIAPIILQTILVLFVFIVIRDILEKILNP